MADAQQRLSDSLGTPRSVGVYASNGRDQLVGSRSDTWSGPRETTISYSKGCGSVPTSNVKVAEPHSFACSSDGFRR